MIKINLAIAILLFYISFALSLIETRYNSVQSPFSPSYLSEDSESNSNSGELCDPSRRNPCENPSAECVWSPQDYLYKCSTNRNRGKNRNAARKRQTKRKESEPEKSRVPEKHVVQGFGSIESVKKDTDHIGKSAKRVIKPISATIDDHRIDTKWSWKSNHTSHTTDTKLSLKPNPTTNRSNTAKSSVNSKLTNLNITAQFFIKTNLQNLQLSRSSNVRNNGVSRATQKKPARGRIIEEVAKLIFSLGRIKPESRSLKLLEPRNGKEDAGKTWDVPEYSGTMTQNSEESCILKNVMTTNIQDEKPLASKKKWIENNRELICDFHKFFHCTIEKSDKELFFTDKDNQDEPEDNYPVCRCYEASMPVVDGICYIPADFGTKSACGDHVTAPYPVKPWARAPILKPKCTPNSDCKESQYWFGRRCTCRYNAKWNSTTRACDNGTKNSVSFALLLASILVGFFTNHFAFQKM